MAGGTIRSGPYGHSGRKARLVAEDPEWQRRQISEPVACGGTQTGPSTVRLYSE